MAKEFDFVAIGDITTDAFIRLSGDDATVETKDGKMKRICLIFGDKIEYDDLVEVAAVGNSPNAAVSAKRLGLSSAIATNMGDDYHGETQLAQLKKEGVATDFVRIHKGTESNYHFVLWYGAERTILVKHHQYPYLLPDIGTPQWVYLSSLGEHSLPFHEAIAAYIKDHPSTKLTFQPGTFQIRLGYEALKNIYAVTELFFCNLEESQRILKTEEKDIKKLLSRVRELGPRIVVITDGPNGAYTYDGEEVWYIPMYPDPKPPVNRTGAGDAFASTFTSLLALGKSVPDALKLAPINSMSVVQFIGAQKGLLSLDELEAWFAKAPEGYAPTKL
ncbi:MAG: carbohydrate kinase family protein [Parcubacteria group bacterium]|nr:carbohydrate kinase family protein [Parcubacteria group bacterium]